MRFLIKITLSVAKTIVLFCSVSKAIWFYIYIFLANTNFLDIKRMGCSKICLLYIKYFFLIKHRFRITRLRKYFLHFLKGLLKTQYSWHTLQSQSLFLHLVSLLSIYQISLHGSFYSLSLKEKERAGPRVWLFCHRVQKQQQHPLSQHACDYLRRAGIVLYPLTIPKLN